MRGNPDGRERPSMQVWNPNDANRSSQVCELNLYYYRSKLSQVYSGIVSAKNNGNRAATRGPRTGPGGAVAPTHHPALSAGEKNGPRGAQAMPACVGFAQDCEFEGYRLPRRVHFVN